MRKRAKACARTLSLGAQGEEVVALQEKLHQLGYDLGPADGNYGYLTEDAVTAFQRDTGLRPDGVAGPKVLSLLNQPTPPGRRRVYVLGAGESLADASRHLGVNVEALRLMNHLAEKARGYPGQRLVCRSHYVLAYLASVQGLRTVEKTATLFSAMAIQLAQISAGKLEVTPLPDAVQELRSRTGLPLWISISPAVGTTGAITAASTITKVPTIAEASAEASMELSLLLNRGALRNKAAKEIGELCGQLKAGLWLDLGRLHWGDGPGLVNFAKALRTELDQYGRPLMVTLPLPEGEARWRWWLTDLDYTALCHLADKVVLGGHIPAGLDSYIMYVRRLEALLRMVPAWKALLGIGLRAEDRDVRGALLGELGYPKAVTASYLAGVKPKWDPGRKLMRAHIPAPENEAKSDKIPGDVEDVERDGKERGEVNQAATSPGRDKPNDGRVLWLPGRDAVLERLMLLHRLNLAGVAFWPVGEEDVRLWEMVPRRIAPEHFGT